MTSVNVGGIYYTVSMDTADLLRGSRAASRELSSLERNLNSIAAAAKAVVSGMAVMKIIDVADEWGQYASRLKMATQSAEEYNIVQDRMIQSANMTFRSINETKESFIQMSPAIRRLGYDLGDTMNAMDTFSGLLVVNSASADKAKSAQRALSIALQKGKLDGDGWMSIYSTMPSIMEVLTQATGMQADELEKLGATGGLAVRELVRSLVQGYLPTMEKVAGMPTTVRDAMQSLTNGFQEYIGKANEAAGITAAIAGGLSELGNNFTILAEASIVAAVAGLTRYGLGLTAVGVAKAKRIIQTTRAAQAELIAAKAEVASTEATLAKVRALSAVAPVQAIVTKATDQHTAALLRQSQAMATVNATSALSRGALTGLLGVLGGPAGIAVTAGLVAASFFLLRDKSKEAQASLDDLGGSAEVATAKFKALTKSQQESARLAADDALVKALADLDTAFKNLTDSSWRFGDTRRTVEWRKENAAAIAELIAKNKAGEISYEELNAKVTALAKSYADANGMGKGWVAQVMAQITALTSASQTAETAKNTVNNVAQANRELAAAANQAAVGVNNANAAMGGTTEAGQKAIAQLERQLALYGKAGSAAGYLYDIEQARKGQGPFADFDPKELDSMGALAQQIARLEASGQNKGPSKADQAAEKRKRDLEQIEEAAKRYVETLQQQYDQVERMTSLERLEYDIKNKKVILGKEEYEIAVDLAGQLDERATKEREIAEALNIKNTQLATERQLLAEIAGYDASIAGTRMGDQARAEMEQRLQLVEQYAQRMQKIEDDRRAATAGKHGDDLARINKMYDDVLRIEQDYQGRSLAAYDEYIQRKREADADWSNGAQRAWANYVEESQNAASLAENAMSNWLSSTEDALVKFAQTGKLSFKDLANSIIADLARIAAKQMITGLLGNIFGSFMGGWSAAGVQASGAVTAPVSGGSVAGTSLPPVSGGRANGGPVGANQMYEVNERGTPELLTYGGKQYLMMGSQSGNVSPMGMGGSGGNVIVQIEVNNHGAQVQQRQETQQLPNGDVMKKFILDVVGQSIAQGQGAPYQGIKGRFNVSERR